MYSWAPPNRLQVVVSPRRVNTQCKMPWIDIPWAKLATILSCFCRNSCKKRDYNLKSFRFLTQFHFAFYTIPLRELYVNFGNFLKASIVNQLSIHKFYESPGNGKIENLFKFSSTSPRLLRVHPMSFPQPWKSWMNVP